MSSANPASTVPAVTNFFSFVPERMTTSSLRARVADWLDYDWKHEAELVLARRLAGEEEGEVCPLAATRAKDLNNIFSYLISERLTSCIYSISEFSSFFFVGHHLLRRRYYFYVRAVKLACISHTCCRLFNSIRHRHRFSRFGGKHRVTVPASKQVRSEYRMWSLSPWLDRDRRLQHALFILARVVEVLKSRCEMHLIPSCIHPRRPDYLPDDTSLMTVLTT